MIDNLPVNTVLSINSSLSLGEIDRDDSALCFPVMVELYMRYIEIEGDWEIIIRN